VNAQQSIAETNVGYGQRAANRAKIWKLLLKYHALDRPGRAGTGGPSSISMDFD
jgi:hypothetical protein